MLKPVLQLKLLTQKLLSLLCAASIYLHREKEKIVPLYSWGNTANMLIEEKAGTSSPTSIICFFRMFK